MLPWQDGDLDLTPPFTKLHIIHPRGGQCKVAISSTSFVPASNRDPRLWALLLISYALGQVTNLSKPQFSHTQYGENVGYS